MLREKRAPRGRKAAATTAKKVVKTRGRTKGSANKVSHPMSVLHKELQALKAALQSAKKKVRTAKKEATQFGTKTAHKLAEAAANEKAKLESKAAELNQKIKAMRIGERVHALYEQVKKAEAEVEAKVKQFQHQLTDKTMDDFERALASFKKKWHKRRAQVNAKRTGAKRKKLVAKAKAAATKVERHVKRLERKATGRVVVAKKKIGAAVRVAKAPVAKKPAAKKAAGRRGRPPKAQ